MARGRFDWAVGGVEAAEPGATWANNTHGINSPKLTAKQFRTRIVVIPAGKHTLTAAGPTPPLSLIVSSSAKFKLAYITVVDVVLTEYGAGSRACL